MSDNNEYLNIHFIRHGESLGNIKTDEIFKHINPPLSARGKEQVKASGKSFENFKNFKLYSSPLTRAFETAMAISSDIIIDNNLPEQGTKVVEGVYDGWEETHKEALERANRVLERIKKEQSTENVIVVSHVGFIQVMIKAALKLDNNFYIDIRNTSVSIIKIHKNGNPGLIEINDISHLENGNNLY